MLIDKYGRKINYLRLAVTDRCNLRCFYCMPETGNNWLNRNELLSWEEMLRICRIFTELGINKIRITGGEPFVRKGILPFLHELSANNKLDELTITTNGVLTAPLVPELKKMGIRSVNLSLDTLDQQRFLSITHRDELKNVLEALDTLIANDITVKLNAVVMEDKNIDDIISLVELTRQLPIAVRFIEEMPFNGGAQHYTQLTWDHAKILAHIQQAYPELQKIKDPENSTSYNYSIPGFNGSIGIIAAYTRSFCGTCNRLRLTPQGVLKTCLYSNSGLDLKFMLRNMASDDAIKEAIVNAVANKAKDGLAAEQSTYTAGAHESMATIGG